MLKFFKSRLKPRSRTHFENLWYYRKGLVIRNIHAKYECPISYDKKVIHYFKVCRRTDGQADKQTDRQTDRKTDRRTERQTDRHMSPSGGALTSRQYLFCNPILPSHPHIRLSTDHSYCMSCSLYNGQNMALYILHRTFHLHRSSSVQ